MNGNLIHTRGCWKSSHPTHFPKFEQWPNIRIFFWNSFLVWLRTLQHVLIDPNSICTIIERHESMGKIRHHFSFIHGIWNWNFSPNWVKEMCIKKKFSFFFTFNYFKRCYFIVKYVFKVFVIYVIKAYWKIYGLIKRKITSLTNYSTNC